MRDKKRNEQQKRSFLSGNHNETLVRDGLKTQHNETLVRGYVVANHNETLVRSAYSMNHNETVAQIPMNYNETLAQNEPSDERRDLDVPERQADAVKGGVKVPPKKGNVITMMDYDGTPVVTHANRRPSEDGHDPRTHHPRRRCGARRLDKSRRRSQRRTHRNDLLLEGRPAQAAGPRHSVGWLGPDAARRHHGRHVQHVDAWRRSRRADGTGKGGRVSH
jgi:hypothetical protein